MLANCICWKDRKNTKIKKETANSRDIYQNELDEACFQHDMDYGDFQDLPGRTASDKVMHDKRFNLKCD